jgi:hypothetical protein
VAPLLTDLLQAVRFLDFSAVSTGRRKMPDANHNDLHGNGAGPSHAYFNSLQPTTTAIQTGLAALGFLLALRFCFIRGYLWQRQPRQSHWKFTNEKASPIVSWERYHTTYSGDVASMKSNTTRLSSEVDSSQGDSPSRALLFSRPADGGNHRQVQFLTRLPPAPPLTPPELSSTIFSAGNKRNTDIGSFINQPNPDYLSVSEPEAVPSITTPVPRRRPYDVTQPISIPTPQVSSLSANEASSPEQVFAPSSYPPSSPLLPPPPPGDEGIATEDDIARYNVDVKGEIISVLDEGGAGWSRHTRVYGGGACLACAASGGGHEGGFYGATVTPEEMR